MGAMRAVWVSEFGPPGVLVARETPDPTPAEGQVVVDVAAASVTVVETNAGGLRLVEAGHEADTLIR